MACRRIEASPRGARMSARVAEHLNCSWRTRTGSILSGRRRVDETWAKQALTRRNPWGQTPFLGQEGDWDVIHPAALTQQRWVGRAILPRSALLCMPPSLMAAARPRQPVPTQVKLLQAGMPYSSVSIVGMAWATGSVYLLTASPLAVPRQVGTASLCCPSLLPCRCF